jgi:predicted nucleotidyltransferase
MKTLEPHSLDEAIRRIVAEMQPDKIYLYGSHAYGQPHRDSDVDLLVVLRNATLPPHKRARAAYRALRGLFFPAEIKVVTREELERRIRWISSVEKVAVEKGRLLYERAAG